MSLFSVHKSVRNTPFIFFQCGNKRQGGGLHTAVAPALLLVFRRGGMKKEIFSARKKTTKKLLRKTPQRHGNSKYSCASHMTKILCLRSFLVWSVWTHSCLFPICIALMSREQNKHPLFTAGNSVTPSSTGVRCSVAFVAWTWTSKRLRSETEDNISVGCAWADRAFDKNYFQANHFLQPPGWSGWVGFRVLSGGTVP